jgi:hypothetical protein
MLEVALEGCTMLETLDLRNCTQVFLLYNKVLVCYLVFYLHITPVAWAGFHDLDLEVLFC